MEPKTCKVHEEWITTGSVIFICHNILDSIVSGLMSFHTMIFLSLHWLVGWLVGWLVIEVRFIPLFANNMSETNSRVDVS